MKSKSIILLRYSLVLIYIWFGLLKLFGMSPITSLVMQTFPFLPNPPLLLILGFGEVLIGIGLFIPFTRKLAILALWGHLAGIFFGVLIHHSLYFSHNNPLLLTNFGEFVAKNIVLLFASIVLFFDNENTSSRT